MEQVSSRKDFGELLLFFRKWNDGIKKQNSPPPESFSKLVRNVLQDSLYNTDEYYTFLKNEVALWVARDVLDSGKILFSTEIRLKSI